MSKFNDDFIRKSGFKAYLEIKNDNYANSMKDEIYFQFFENENNFDFLISKMIRHEQEAGLANIIQYYF